MLTELDKQVGAAKGWKHCPWGAEKKKSFRGEIEPIDEGFLFMKDGKEWHISEDVCHWSTDDAQALELVDELRGKMSFDLYCSPSGIMWYATFSPVRTGAKALMEIIDPRIKAQEVTRSEAICRAYIAAMEWMREKKG